jgi:hypothetical protein
MNLLLLKRHLKGIFSLHLNSGKLTIEQIEEIKQKATYIFANRRNMEEHNREQLKQQHSAKNPIATSCNNFIKRKAISWKSKMHEK